MVISFGGGVGEKHLDRGGGMDLARSSDGSSGDGGPFDGSGDGGPFDDSGDGGGGNGSTKSLSLLSIL